jgi:hypothetical protein
MRSASIRLRSRCGVFGSRQTLWEICGQGQDALALSFVDAEPIGRSLALVAFLSLGQVAQLCIPVGFQRVGDEPVGGVHLHVALAGAIGLVLCSFDLPVTQAIGLVMTSRYLRLNGERELERQRRDGLDEQLAYRGIDPCSQDALAQRVTEKPSATRAHVVRDEFATPTRVVVHVHAAAAQPADDAPLQEGGTFARRARSSFEADCLRGCE